MLNATTPAALTALDLCPGHGGMADCRDWDSETGHWCGDDADHGVVSYCAGDCAGARDAYADDIRRGRIAHPEPTTDTIAVELGSSLNGGRCIVRFEGPDADAQAAAYLGARTGTHGMYGVDGEPFDGDAFPLTYAIVWPTCEHGMSAHLCMGPQHFLSADQERALGW